MADVKKQTGFPSNAQHYVFAGVLTLIPLWITWLVFKFFLAQLSQAGMPWVRAVFQGVQTFAPSMSEWLSEPWFQSALAVMFTLLALYLLGLAATRVMGRRLLGLLDGLIEHIPLVHPIYGGTKKLLTALQQKPKHVQRVVLIEFPSPEMKTVGFVTRLVTDKDTGQELAAVYVPTTPNPTSGYLEIVPVEKLISTDWTIDEAMSFIISGGAVAPDHINYAKSASFATDAAPSADSSAREPPTER